MESLRDEHPEVRKRLGSFESAEHASATHTTRVISLGVHSRAQSPVFFVVVALKRLQPLEKKEMHRGSRRVCRICSAGILYGLSS